MDKIQESGLTINQQACYSNVCDLMCNSGNLVPALREAFELVPVAEPDDLLGLLFATYEACQEQLVYVGLALEKAVYENSTDKRYQSLSNIWYNSYNRYIGNQ